MTISTERLREIQNRAETSFDDAGYDPDPIEIAAIVTELIALRAATEPADDPESVLHALQIASIEAPYSDYSGQLYCHRPYSTDGYRDAEFRDHGLARAVRILCNNAKSIAATLATRSSEAEGREAVIDEAAFLIERLHELENGWEDEEAYREYCGHVAPSVARLNNLLRALKENSNAG